MASMTSRAVLLLIPAGLIGVWLWGARSESHPEAVGRSATIAAQGDLPDAEVAALPQSDVVARTPTPAEPSAAAPAESPDAPVAADLELAVHGGTWVVIDSGGVEREGSSGHFVIRLFDSLEDVEVAVTDGKWSVEMPSYERFDILTVELGGQPTAKVGHMDGLGSPPDQHLRLVGRWLRPVVLTVVDAATRRQLSNLTVLGEGRGQAWEHPGAFDPERVVVDDAASPVVLPIPEHPDDHQSLWVRGPDHGWGHIVVPRSVGGEFVLALHPSGQLSVAIHGAAPGVALSLRLRRNGDAEDWTGIRYEEGIGERTRVAFDSLAAGHYVVTVEIGHRYRYPRILAAEVVDLAGGEHAEVTLDVSAFVPPPLTEIAGTLSVPEAWRFQQFGLHLGLIGEPAVDGMAQRWIGSHSMTLLDGSSDEYAFVVPRIQVGHWELRFDPVGTSLAVDVPEAGVRDLRIDVPPPVDVTVHVEDEAGEPVSDMRVNWVPDRTGFESSGVLSGAGLRSPGRFTFTAPQGRVEIWCMSKQWSFIRQMVEIGPGARDVHIKATRACGVVLAVSEAGSKLRVSDFAPVIRLAEGDQDARL
ncbi:MAG: hypothetical protein ACI8PZ_006881, partial [Myxococcota bacterium]